MFRALFIATISVTLLVNIIFLLATRERVGPFQGDGTVDVATATMAIISSGAFSSRSLVVDESTDENNNNNNHHYHVHEESNPKVTKVGQPESAKEDSSQSEWPHNNNAARKSDDFSGRAAPEVNRRRKRRWRIAEPATDEAKAPSSASTDHNSREEDKQFDGNDSAASQKAATKRQKSELNDVAYVRETRPDKGLSGGDDGDHLDRSWRLKGRDSRDKNRLSKVSAALASSLEANRARTQQQHQLRASMSSSFDSSVTSFLPNTTTFDVDNDGRQMSRRLLNIRVKSSKNRVLISVDDSIIYQSPVVSSRQHNNKRALGRQEDFVLGSSSNSTEKEERQTREIASSSGDKLRGIHVVVLNQFDGSLMAKRTFDTYMPDQDDQLCLFLKQLSRGRLVIFAVEDEASFRMAAQSQARKLLKSRDWRSQLIGKLHWRDMWTFVAKIGDQKRANLGERMTKSSQFQDWAPDCELKVQVQLDESSQDTQLDCFRLELKQAVLKGDESKRNELERRIEFCSRVEGYGRVCDCQYPAPITFGQEQKLKMSTSSEASFRMDQVPIVVIASNRPYYLYRMLRSLLQANGIKLSMVTVFIDGFYDEPIQVAKLFNLRAIQQTPMGQRSARISHHYKTTLTLTFEQLYTSADYALIFEEDLDVARDTLVYFNQTIGLLERDPSLYCASAWNDQGYEHSIGDSERNSRILRIETMPGLGWLLSRRLFVEELAPKWPSFELAHDWDMWIRTGAIRRGRECLIPELSRTYHFGSSGTNMNSYFQRQYFTKHAFNLMSNVSSEEFARELVHLQQDQYEISIDRLLNEAQVITNKNGRLKTNLTETSLSDEQFLCSLANNDQTESKTVELNNNNNFDDGYYRQQQEELAKRVLQTDDKDMINENSKNSVIFLKMIDQEDYGNWLKVAHCWHLWDLDARGQHKSMWRIHLNGRQLFVVGSPASPYSRSHKSTKLEPFDLLLPKKSTATSVLPIS